MNINKSPVRTTTLLQCYAISSLPLSGNSGTEQGASMIGDLLRVPEYFEVERDIKLTIPAQHHRQTTVVISINYTDEVEPPLSMAIYHKHQVP